MAHEHVLRTLMRERYGIVLVIPFKEWEQAGVGKTLDLLMHTLEHDFAIECMPFINHTWRPLEEEDKQFIRSFVGMLREKLDRDLLYVAYCNRGDGPDDRTTALLEQECALIPFSVSLPVGDIRLPLIEILKTISRPHI